MTDRDLEFATRAVHGGHSVNPLTGAIAPDISTSVNNVHPSDAGGFSANDNPDITALPYVYGRWSNPTVRLLEKRVAVLEEAGDGIATASGMAAAALLFFGLLEAGDHLIVSDVCYPGVRELASQILPRYGIEVTAVDFSRLDLVEAAIRPDTKLIHAESPCNPILRLTDLRGLARLGETHGITTSVDSTMATPVATRPLTMGIDFVMHSLTKYINGHGDALGGMLLGAKDRIEALRAGLGVRLGASLDPRAAALILRGADTLPIRVKAASASALQVAQALEAHENVLKVLYPGLPGHPQHALARQQMAEFGAVISFQVRNPAETAERLSLRGNGLVKYAVSLGHQHSTLCLMKTDDLMLSTYRLAGAALESYHDLAGDGLIRLSVGLEDPRDIIGDLAPHLV